MLKDDIKNIKSGKHELRKFGITVGIVLGVLGGLFLWREKSFYIYFFSLSAMLLFLGSIAPSLLKHIYKAWMTLALVIGWFMTRVILSVLFYVVITPLSLILRLFGKEFLDLKMNTTEKSNWKYREKKALSRDRYEKQF